MQLMQKMFRKKAFSCVFLGSKIVVLVAVLLLLPSCRTRLFQTQHGASGTQESSVGAIGHWWNEVYVRSYLWAFPREAVNSLEPKAGEQVFHDVGKEGPMCYYRRYVDSRMRRFSGSEEELELLCSAQDTMRLNPRSLTQSYIETRLKQDEKEEEKWAIFKIAAGNQFSQDVCLIAFGGIVGALPCIFAAQALFNHFAVQARVEKNAFAKIDVRQQELGFESIRVLESTLVKTFRNPEYALKDRHSFSAECPTPDRLPFCQKFLKEGRKPLVSLHAGMNVSCANLGQNRIRIFIDVTSLRNSDSRNFDADGRLEVKVADKIVFQKRGGPLDSAQYAEFIYEAPQSGPVDFAFVGQVQVGDKVFSESVRRVRHTFYAHSKIGEGFYCNKP